MDILCGVPVGIFVVISMMLRSCHSGANYSDIHALFEEKLGRANYNPEIRPVKDHSTITNVTFNFTLNYIAEIDDVRQTMLAIGYFGFLWQDELIPWDPSDISGLLYFQPHPKQIWRPRMTVSNSIETRDPFLDTVAPNMVVFTGLVRWGPSFMTPTSCQLKMDKYPFDIQECHIFLCPMNHFSDSMALVKLYDKVDVASYMPNTAWELVSSKIEVLNYGTGVGNIYQSCASIQIKLKRRPTYFVINIVLPVVLLSFLNIFVFAIPVDSGEKISYNITVLLALTVFLSMVSSMMPQTSDSVPAVTMYLFSLLIVSVCSMIVAIGIVALHHKDEKEESHLKAKVAYQDAVNKITKVRHVIDNLKGNVSDTDKDLESTKAGEQSQIGNQTNRYRVISKYADIICFIVFMMIWIFLTSYYFIYVTT